MQYLDDIFELIEDLPEEVNKRFDRIRKWDKEAQEQKHAFEQLRKRLMDTSTKLTPEEKNKLCKDLGERIARMRKLAHKKVEIAERTQRLVTNISDKVNESSYLCKIELEVESAGCTEIIEKNFCESRRLRPSSSHMVDCQMQFEPIDGPSPLFSDLDYLPVRGVGRPLKEHNKRRDRSISGTPPPSMISRKNARKGDKMKKKDKGANKMISSRGRRQKDPLDLGGFDMDDVSSRASSTREPDDFFSSWPDRDTDLNNEEFDDLFPKLPSPPPEFLEDIMKGGSHSVFGMDDDLSSLSPSPSSSLPPPLGASSGSGGAFCELQSPPSHHSSHSMHDGSNRDSFPPFRRDSHDHVEKERKKRQLTFSHVNELSLHGRPRKLTNRAEESIAHINEKRKDSKRTLRDDENMFPNSSYHGHGPATMEEEDGEEATGEEDDQKWCLCGLPSSGDMICCDNEAKCRIKWFHFNCIGLSEAPAGAWFCPECRKEMMKA